MFLNLPHFTLQSNSSSTSSAALAILIGSPPHQTMGNGTCVLYCSRHCSNAGNLLAQTPAGCYLGPKPALITQHTSLFLFYELIVFLSPATKKISRSKQRPVRDWTAQLHGRSPENRNANKGSSYMCDNSEQVQHLFEPLTGY